MAYADYIYYTGTYKGNVIPDATSFARVSEQASVYVDRQTFGRLEGRIVGNEVKDAVCAVSEIFYRFAAADADSQGGAIASESVGSHSVSYNARQSGGAEELRALRAVTLYLGGTGLLYRGEA